MDNNTNQTVSKCKPQAQHVSIPVLLCIVYLIGLFLNGFSLWVFSCRIPRWSCGIILQFNLAVSDAIAAPVTPMLAHYFAMDSTWTLGTFPCQLKMGLLSAHFYGSTVFLTLISIQRYMAVVHFNRDSCMKRKSFVKKLCIGIWTFLFVKACVYGYLLPVSSDGEHMHCLSIYQKDHTTLLYVINFVLFVFGFILPFTVSLVCYTRLARSVGRININSERGQLIKARSMRMISVCLVIFALCFIPLNVVRTLGVVVVRHRPGECQLLARLETAYYSSYILGGINCCLDPLIYFFGSNNFNRVFRQSIRLLRVQEKTENQSESETASRKINRNAISTDTI
ncbi:P2Y purinoceptor 4-like [Chanos chanos]|uniref:P2Y purinoceptor 4-like n=1 Tax=Chanos chanos TaxID=29144 RepID=A0A6J2WTN0_CHACN|nr:P2Y purinoceptor 4-like [Chanos chanos]